MWNSIEPGHEKTCLMSYANNKGTDQPAHPRSLISTFVVHCLDSIISLDSIAEISRLQLVSMAAQAGLCLDWSETPEDTFCYVVAQLYWFMMIAFLFEPVHEKMCLMPYANNKGADQPAHPRSLISAFVVRCQDRMISLVCISETSRF